MRLTYEQENNFRFFYNKKHSSNGLRVLIPHLNFLLLGPETRRSYGSGYIAPFSEIIIPNPKRRLDLFLDSLPLPRLIPHNASDESSGTSMCSHKSSIQDPYRPSTSPLRLDDI
ncbi:hypothetical protein YC2023_060759 [Brassica napus]